MKNENCNIDTVIKKNKNRTCISFSWGFEYRYLQEISDNLCDLISKHYRLNKDKIILIRYPSIPAYDNLNEYLNISNIIKITPELVCVEGDITDRYMLHLKGTLAYLMPGQCYIDATENIINSREISNDEIEKVWQQRLLDNYNMKKSYSEFYNISTNQIFFNWGSGGSIELILWLLMNKIHGQPKMLINVPNYFYTCALAQKFGYSIKPISSYSKGKYKFPSSKIIGELETKKYDIVVLTSPNNPFGITINQEDFEAILNALPLRTLALIDFTGLTNKSEYHIRDVLYNHEWYNKNIIILDSLSKKFEMCHVRVGYIIATNSTIINDLNLERYSPILTKYAYTKLEFAFNHPEMTNRVLRKHRWYFSQLKSIENKEFRIISPQYSNFIVSKFRNYQQVDKFIKFLKEKYRYYDLPFKGIGIYNSGKGSLSQDFIQYLPKNNLRILEETAPFICKSIKLYFRNRTIKDIRYTKKFISHRSRKK